MRIGWRLLMSCLLTSSRLAVHWQPGMSKVLLTIQAFVTFFFAPMALFWLFGVVTDIIAYGPALTKCAGNADTSTCVENPWTFFTLEVRVRLPTTQLAAR